jgi:hypothetical protein
MRTMASVKKAAFAIGQKYKKPLLQLFETSRPKRWGQNPNQLVILPIVIFAQSIEGALGECFRDEAR